MSAGGITTAPSRRNPSALTCMPSRRTASSHSNVASDPLMDRFGPRSMPISSAAVVPADRSAMPASVPAMRPAGRLLTRLPATAAPTPAAQGAAPAQSPLVQGVANAPGTLSAVPPAAASTLLQRFDASPAPGGGYRIGDNAPPGMVPGDVIQSVNRNALTDPVAANAAFSAAQSSGSAQVQILRNGRRITLTVPIR